MGRRRLDAELVRRGLAATRADAERSIRAGLVTVGGAPATKATTLVAADEALALGDPARSFVSRGGEKLAAALDAFAVDPRDRDCLDAGASTGGFTDCLLQRGARHVVAVDVGYGQLAWELRVDPRVTALDRTDVRDLDVEDLPYRATLLTADLSFISLALVVPALLRVAAPEADLILLVKPQFEGRAHVEPGGVVRDRDGWRTAIERAMAAVEEAGAGPLGLIPSPIQGPAGNVEFLLHAGSGRSGRYPFDVEDVLDAAERLGRR